MRFISFTNEQIDDLLKNKNVSKFRGKYISYSRDFKVKAVNQYLNERMSPRQIFEQAGFDLNVIGKLKPKYLIHDWSVIFREKGVKRLQMENRGKGASGRARVKKEKVNEKLTDKEKIKRLQLEVQYLKKENDFLVKLRAKKAE